MKSVGVEGKLPQSNRDVTFLGVMAHSGEYVIDQREQPPPSGYKVSLVHLFRRSKKRTGQFPAHDFSANLISGGS
jgi:hypothetical protein